jgi:hypothetical protein
MKVSEGRPCRPGKGRPTHHGDRQRHRGLQGGVHIEKINYPMLFKDGATPVEYWAGLQHDIAKGWLKPHESGTS